MGQRRGGGRSNSNLPLPGYYSSGRKNLSLTQAPTTRLNRQGRFEGPLRHSSPNRFSYPPPRRVSWSSDCSSGSNSSTGTGIVSLFKQDKLSTSPPREYADEHSLSSDNSPGNPNQIPECLSSSESCGSLHSPKKNDRPSAARPSNPLRYKTELCRSFDEGGICRFGSTCTFAHGIRELRAVPRHPRYKTDPCRTYHTMGYCQYGARCHFVHDPEEAAGVSPMRGHKLNLRQDRLSAALLAMAKTAGISPDPDNHNIFLDNLLGLHAVSTLKDEALKSAEEARVNAGLLKLESKVDLDLNCAAPSYVALPSASPESSLSESVNGMSIDSSQDYMKPTIMENCETNTTRNSIDTGIFSCTNMSVSLPEDAWWESWNVLTPPLSPNNDGTAMQKPLEHSPKAFHAPQNLGAASDSLLAIANPPPTIQNRIAVQNSLAAQNSLTVSQNSLYPARNFSMDTVQESIGATPNGLCPISKPFASIQNAQATFTAVQSILQAANKPFLSMAELREAITALSPGIIANPMEMSRNLLFPSIVELPHKS